MLKLKLFNRRMWNMSNYKQECFGFPYYAM